MLEEVIVYEPYFTEEERINDVGFHTPEEYSKIVDKRAQDDKHRHLSRYLKAKENIKKIKIGDKVLWTPNWSHKRESEWGKVIGLNEEKLAVKLKILRLDMDDHPYDIDWYPADEISKND